MQMFIQIWNNKAHGECGLDIELVQHIVYSIQIKRPR